MRACHSCNFYNNGWCTYRDQGVSAGGGCSHWSGSSRVGKSNSRTKKNSRKRRKGLQIQLGCGTCAWWEGHRCKNPDSEAYNKTMTSGALCTIYQHEKGDKLRNFSMYLKDDGSPKNETMKGMPRIARDIKTIPISLDDKPSSKSFPNNARNNLKLDKRRERNERCNRCAYLNGNICSNDMSKSHGKRVSLTDWCIFYKQFNR